MMDEGEKLVPSFRKFRPLRAWAGVRPLYQESTTTDLRDVTRKYTLLDHSTRDGVDGFITITGGKWTTYRMMAEHTADLVCQKLNTNRPCRTAETPLKNPHGETKLFTLGQRLDALEKGELDGQLICECEIVTRPQIERSLNENHPQIINDLRRDLRVGMGPCQGGFCTYRVAGITHEKENLPPYETNKALVDFLQARWKGMSTVLWGQHLRQMHLDEGIYLGLLGVDKLPTELTGADTGRLGEIETEGFYEIGVEPSLVQPEK
jgi:glycerol-3-phosphate dehydrogenase